MVVTLQTHGTMLRPLILALARALALWAMLSTVLPAPLLEPLLGRLSVTLDAQTRQAPDALARALQQRYQGVRDFSADFTHTYRGGVLRTQASEHGTVVIKKPSRMRWVYTGPERKEFVSD